MRLPVGGFKRIGEFVFLRGRWPEATPVHLGNIGNRILGEDQRLIHVLLIESGVHLIGIARRRAAAGHIQRAARGPIGNGFGNR
jgi:hypothetical protein